MTGSPNCTPDPGVQSPPAIGHNSQEAPVLYGQTANWLDFAEKLDLWLLSKLHLRIEHKRAGLKDLLDDRDRIRRRCIKRMRRARGLN